MDKTLDSRHEVQFYSSDVVLIESLSRFIASALRSRNAVVVLATEAHREDLVQQLIGQGFDIGDVIKRGIYISLDAYDALSTFIVDGAPDRLRFFEALCTLIESAVKAAQTDCVSICGECVGLLCAEGNIKAAIRLEEVANDFAQSHNVEMMCAYPLSSFGSEHAVAYKRICAEHTAVYSH